MPNERHTIPADTLRMLLASTRDPKRDRHLDLIIASREAMASVVGFAMVAGAMPGIEVTYLDALPGQDG